MYSTTAYSMLYIHFNLVKHFRIELVYRLIVCVFVLVTRNILVYLYSKYKYIRSAACKRWQTIHTKCISDQNSTINCANGPRLFICAERDVYMTASRSSIACIICYSISGWATPTTFTKCS